MKSQAVVTLLLAVLAITGCSGGSSPATGTKTGNVNSSCNGYPQAGSNSVTVCDLRRYDDLPATGQASVATDNGDVLAQGASRSSIALEAYVYATAPTEDEANNLAAQVVIHTDNDDFYATGPSTQGGSSSSCNVTVTNTCVVGDPGGSSGSGSSNQSWSVSFTVALPVNTSLSASSGNGSVEVDNVTGTGDYQSGNGALYLAGLAGDVTASTGNGDLDMDLGGHAWSGNGVNASSANGTITLHAPADYSAQFSLSSSSGTVHSDFSGRTDSGPNASDSETTGHGGATISATSQNGDVNLLKKG